MGIQIIVYEKTRQLMYFLYVQNAFVTHVYKVNLWIVCFLFKNIYADLQSRSEQRADLKIYLGRQKFAGLQPVYIDTKD